MAQAQVTTKPGMILPSAETFDVKAVSKVQETEAAGTVKDLDHSLWASAIVDLKERDDRVAACRARLQAKGYQKVEGEVQVVGFQRPEVWVMPRAMYALRMEAKAKHIEYLVSIGKLTDQATQRPAINRVASSRQ